MRVIIQLRSPKIVTETDAVSPACKIGVVLDPIEAVRLAGILASAECVHGCRRRRTRANRRPRRELKPLAEPEP